MLAVVALPFSAAVIVAGKPIVTVPASCATVISLAVPLNVSVSPSDIELGVVPSVTEILLFASLPLAMLPASCALVMPNAFTVINPVVAANESLLKLAIPFVAAPLVAAAVASSNASLL